jgi:hypothetical protein
VSPILFLDIDGVLNSADFLYQVRLKTPQGPIVLADQWQLSALLDPGAIQVLNQILDASNAEIVVSSTWRLSLSVGDFRKVFQEMGIRGKILGVTPHLSCRPRGEEIHQWLLENRKLGHPFAILDDDSDMGDLAPFLVKTTFEKGLGQEHIQQTLSLLGCP